MRALAALRLAERTALVILFLTMVALFALNVVARQLGGDLASDLAWIDEAVRVMNLFLVFLAAGLALERGRHVSVHTWRDRLAARSRLPLRKLIDALGLLFSLYVAWLGLKMALFVFSTGQQSPTLGLAMGWIYMAPAIGFVLLALRYGLNLAGVTDRYAAQAAAEANAEEPA
ncbi:TRAP transporter small permease [Oceanicella sp. SM1341]|uniref:TRAP transporter small permease n=1 Tax=Oceanicella sp. SM1341 TaxID=1548889 RepID=UPI000E48B216|nr:TRAP transporter small permease subunit [Oceanicella sp. SM1341]